MAGRNLEKKDNRKNSNQQALSTRRRQTDDIFSDFLRPWFGPMLSPLTDRWLEPWGRPSWRGDSLRDLFTPACDIDETDSEYHLSFDLPGVKKEDVHVEVQSDQLIVSGERREERSEGEGRSHFRERSYGSFERRMMLPTNVDPDRIDAHFENGVLVVSIPKSEESKRRQIQINGGR